LPGRKPAEAVKGYFGQLQAALSCVTNAVLRVSSYSPGGPHVLLLNNNLPVRLHGPGIWFALTLRFRVTECTERGRGRWRVETTGYRYSVQDAPDHEVLRYDWHPESQEGGRLVSFPHLHVHAGRSVGRSLHKVHLPTGQVEVESVLALLLRDLGVRARRRDWKRILRQAGGPLED